MRIVLGHDRVVGAVVMGEQTLSRPLTRMIRDDVDATPLCRALREHPRVAARWSVDLRGDVREEAIAVP